MANVATTSYSAISFVDRIRAAYANFRAARAQRSEYVRTIRELDSLSTRELKDLAISRCDIPRLAHEHVYGA